jgi:hypothetical protein
MDDFSQISDCNPTAAIHEFPKGNGRAGKEALFLEPPPFSFGRNTSKH